MLDLIPVKRIPVIDVAERLGIPVRGTKAMCFMGHDKASPSLSFLKNRNTWRCFGACGKHGDTISLVMEKEGIDFKSALEWFAINFGVDVRVSGSIRPGKHKSENNLTASGQVNTNHRHFASDDELYAWLIDHCPAVSSPTGINYLETHGISLECANRFNIRELRDPRSIFCRLEERFGAKRVYRSGVACGANEKPQRLLWSSPALLFPFYKSGSVSYVQARMFASDKKYLNPRGIAKPLFNADRLENLPAKSLVNICEGVPDALAMESHGLVALGVLGATSFRPEWVDQFLGFEVEVLAHGDAAGERFATDISNFFLARGKSVRCLRLPTGEDAADILAKRKRSMLPSEGLGLARGVN